MLAGVAAVTEVCVAPPLLFQLKLAGEERETPTMPSVADVNAALDVLDLEYIPPPAIVYVDDVDIAPMAYCPSTPDPVSTNAEI